MPVNNPNRRIKLSITTQIVYSSSNSQSYRLTVTASDGNLMPNEVFRYVRINPTSSYPDGLDKYLGICTPAELNTLPIDDPDETLNTLWFRKSTLDLTIDTEEYATSAVENIVNGIRQLKIALDYVDNQTQTSEYWIGTPP